MKSYDFEAVTCDGDIYCVDCLPDGVTVDSDDVSPIFADSEWDYVPVCCECGADHDYVTVLGNDEDEDETPTEPTEDDYVTRDYVTFYQYRKAVVTVAEDTEWTEAIKAHMDKEQFWPDVWFQGERGDWNLLSVETGQYA